METTTMYNEQLESLIELALADGELTEKEKQVLFKKAQELGIDLDEFEMVLDAEFYKKKQALQKEKPATISVPPAAPKSNKYGDVRKCPACGAMVSSFVAKCPDCNYEFTNIEANVSFTKLMNMLEEVETQRKEDSVLGNFTKSIFGKKIGLSFDAINDRKKQIIKNYPIPTTKEDILEFLSMAIPNAKKQGNFFTRDNPEYALHNEFVPVWKSKCEQIMIKAKLSLKDDAEVIEMINRYAEELKIKL